MKTKLPIQRGTVHDRTGGREADSADGSDASCSDAGAPAADGWFADRLGESHVAYLDFAAEVERRRQGGQRLSPVYRIYLRNPAGNVVSGHTIAIEDDDEAIKLAWVLCHACAEVRAGFEVWKGEALLIASPGAGAPPDRKELSRRAQHAAIDTEIALRDSRTALAESRRLLRTIEEWQEGQSATTTPRRRRER